IFRDVPCYALGLADELRYLCTHHIVHHGAAEWLWLVDIAELLRRIAQDHTWDWKIFVEVTIDFHLATPVLLAFFQAKDLLGAPIPTEPLEILMKASQSADERARWLASTFPMPSLRGARALLRAASNLHEQAQMIRMLVCPDRTYLREYHGWVPGQSIWVAHT